jgi:hypothetical protein
MGAGASTLTSDQKAQLAGEVKALYDKCTADGLDDDIVQDIVTTEYKRIMKSLSTTSVPFANKPAPLNNTPSASRLATRSGLSVKASTASSKDGKPKVTRRRSFDTTRASGRKNIMGIDKDEARAIINSRSEVILKASSTDAAEQPIDSWDSVTQQPFCHLCQMAFKSAAFLERHLKYSDLHAKYVAKRDGNDKKPEEKAVPPVPKVPSKDESQPLAADTSTKLAEPQVEGKHFKLLYSGSKLFWRTQKSIDVDIYLHVLTNVLEVITFDSAKHRETARIYLDYSIVQVHSVTFPLLLSTT